MTKWIDQTTWRFLLVGCINTLFATSIMFLAYNVLGLSYWLSSASNYFFGSILSYFLNKYFTFQKKDKSIGDILPFALNITIYYYIAYGLAKPLVANLFSSLSVSMKDNGTMLVGMCLFVGLNYLGQQYFVFQKKRVTNHSYSRIWPWP